jgi:phosphoglycerate dehydrogenase-like enzyme
VDETALVQALRDGKIAGAGLDVFEQTPLPPSHPLWDMDNVFVTPVIGGSERSIRREHHVDHQAKPAKLPGRPPR